MGDGVEVNQESPPILEIEALSVSIPIADSPVVATSMKLRLMKRWLRRRSIQPASILSDVSLSIIPGEVVMIAGQSGSGKSTLLRAVAGLARVESGVLSLRDERILSDSKGVSPSLRRLGFMSQNAPLIPHLTVAENISFGLTTAYTTFKSSDVTSRRARVDTLLALLELEALAQRRPDTLSGGQRRRVALAQTLAQPRDLYLLDEPFSNLEPALKRRLANRVVTEIRSCGGAVLWTSHHLDLGLRYADRIAVLADRTLVAVGTPQTLFERPPNYPVAELFNVISWHMISMASTQTTVNPRLRLGFHKHAWSVVPQPEFNTLASTSVSLSPDILEKVCEDAFEARSSHHLNVTSLSEPLIFKVDLLKRRSVGDRAEITFRLKLKSIGDPLILSVDIDTCNRLSLEGSSFLMYSGAIFWSHEVGSQQANRCVN